MMERKDISNRWRDLTILQVEVSASCWVYHWCVSVIQVHGSATGPNKRSGECRTARATQADVAARAYYQATHREDGRTCECAGSSTLDGRSSVCLIYCLDEEEMYIVM